jgi:protein-disulfide isomerase
MCLNTHRSVRTLTILIASLSMRCVGAEAPPIQSPSASVQNVYTGQSPASSNAEQPQSVGDAFPEEKAPIPVASDDIVLGDRQAPLTAVIFGGYTKSLGRFTQRIAPLLTARYGTQVRFVYKDFYMPHYPDQALAAEAAHAAFAESPAVFSKLAGLLASFEGTATVDSLAGFAQVAGANRERLVQLLNNHAYAPRVSASMQQVEKLHLQGSPVTFINGLAVQGAPPSKAWDTEVVEEVRKELETIAKARSSGVSARDIYGFRCSNNFGKKLVSQSN